MTSIVFVGGGNMARCLIGGMLANGFDSHEITATARSQGTCNKLAQDFSIATSDDNQKAVSLADVVVLAVKPQVMQGVAESLAGSLNHRPLIISVAAGIPVTALQSWLGGDRAIVRAMPNTPSIVMHGATGMFGNDSVSDEQRALCDRIFNAVGISHWVADEGLIDAVIAVSGSGPAYYFLFMEIMEKIGAELGLDPETARQLTLQTAQGAAQMAAQGEHSTAELRRMVTSPGGTTQRAIETFQQAGIEQIFRDAMRGAVARAGELSAELTK